MAQQVIPGGNCWASWLVGCLHCMQISDFGLLVSLGPTSVLFNHIGTAFACRLGIALRSSTYWKKKHSA